MLFWSMGLGNMIAIVLFTQVWPEYYIVMLMAGATISLGGLYVYGAIAKRQPVPSVVGADAGAGEAVTGRARFKAFAPLILGVVIVVLTRVPSVADGSNICGFGVAAWGYAPIRINILTSAGFFIFVTALVCYLFRVKDANAAKDFVIATKRSRRSLATLLVGSATVYLMVDTGQIRCSEKCFRAAGRWSTRRFIRPWRFWAAWLSGRDCRRIFFFRGCRWGSRRCWGFR